MIIPAAMFIEQAADSIKYLDAEVIKDELTELAAAGVKPEFTGAALPSWVSDFQSGYLLGLQTARTIIVQSAPGKERDL